MMQEIKIVRKLLEEAYSVVSALGDEGRIEEERTETGARQSRAEKQIYQALKEFVRGLGLAIRYEAEDHNPIDYFSNPSVLIRVDPMDGTTYYVRNRRIICEPIAVVAAITPIKQDLIFSDVIAGGVIDIRSGELWIASKGKGAFKGVSNGKLDQFKARPQYRQHTPVQMCDFYRRVNGLTRSLWPQSHEVLNEGSTAVQMVCVALGEADLYFNGLPMVSDEGQRGHELGACYRILKEAGGYALDMRTGQELGNSPFLFNEQTPVVMGVNKEKVDEFWNKVQENFTKLDNALRAGEIKSLKDLWDFIPPERWSLG